MAFLELRTPRDMLEKAKREHARMSAMPDIDHIFNFFVTAHHIRDYVEKSGAATPAQVEELFQDSDMKDCRDLCDKAKHLRLTKRPDPTTHQPSGALGGAPIGALPLGAGGEWELWSNGRTVAIVPLTARVLRKWEAFFERNDL